MFQPRIITLMKIFFLPFGIVTGPEYEKFISLFALCFNVAIIFGIFGIVKVFTDRNSSLLENIYTLNSALGVVRSFWLGRLHREVIRSLYQKICDLIFESKEFRNMLDKITKDVVRYSMVVYLAVFFVVSVPLYTITFTDVPTSDLKALIFPCWYPWSRNNVLLYTLTISLQISTILSSYYVLFFLTSVFFCLVAFNYICTHMIGVQILTMEERIRKNMYESGWPEKPKKGRRSFGAPNRLRSEEWFDEQMYTEFVGVIRNHQNLLRHV